MSRTPEPGSDLDRAWQQALDLWGVRLAPPVLAPDAGAPSFAWFGFPPQVNLDVPAARRAGVADFLPSVLAHEVGHHVLSPSTRVGGQKITHQLARALTVSRDLPIAVIAEVAPRLANLWSDLLVNVAVAARQQLAQPDAEQEMVRLWRALAAPGPVAPLWWLVLRAYEHLWSLPAGDLAGPIDRGALAPDQHPELDAQLLAETVRRFATDPVSGALRFGLLVTPYLAEPEGSESGQDPGGCGGERDAPPPTAAELDEVLGDPRLQEAPVHPAEAAARARGLAPPEPAGPTAAGQGYGLADTRALWPAADRNTVAAAWYAAAARRWVRPLLAPVPPDGPAVEGIPGPLETWDSDEDPAAIDWPGTLAAGPQVIPGVTTRRRTTVDEPPPTRRRSIRLDLYLDGSGSMPAPTASESPAVLAATIIVASVLRAPGGRVRVTTFSGPGEVSGTPSFTRNRAEAAAAVLHHPGGGTTFPLDLLAARAQERRPDGETRERHLVVLSDDGLESMFGRGQPQYAGVAARVAAQLTTATLILLDPRRQMAAPAAEAGYRVHYLDRLDDAPAACAALAAAILAGPGG